MKQNWNWSSTLERFPKKMLQKTLLYYVNVKLFQSHKGISEFFLKFRNFFKINTYQPSIKYSSAVMLVMCWWKWSSSWYSAWWRWRSFDYVELVMMMNSCLSCTGINGGLLWEVAYWWGWVRGGSTLLVKLH